MKAEFGSSDIQPASQKSIERGVVNPKEKPFTMILDGHGDGNVDKIAVFKKEIEKKLEATPYGKVSVILEAANGTVPATEMIQKSVSEGTIPSEAMLNAIDLFAPVDYSSSNVSTNPSKTYNDVRGEALDAIAKRYPNRLDLVIEGHPIETLDEVTISPDEAYGTWNITWEEYYNDREKAYTRIKENVDSNLPKLTARDNRITDQIEERLDDPDVIGGVGLIGAYHTPVTHELARDGYQVKRIFPDAENGVYVFSPEMTYERDVRFHPEKEHPIDKIDAITKANINVPYVTDDTYQKFLTKKHKWINGNQK